jgi:hypothetical protein
VRDRGAAVSVPEAGGWYNLLMTRLLEQVVKDLRTLSRDEQDRAARLLLALLGAPHEAWPERGHVLLFLAMRISSEKVIR